MVQSENSAEMPDAPDRRGGAEAVNPAALTPEHLARMLGVPEEKVREHLAAGAPVAADGTINLVHYAAWLNKRLVTAEPEAKPDGD